MKVRRAEAVRLPAAPAFVLGLAALLLLGGCGLLAEAVPAREPESAQESRPAATNRDVRPAPTPPAQRAAGGSQNSARRARPTPTPVPTPLPPPKPGRDGSIGRLVIPRIGINAPLIVLGITRSGEMEAPRTGNVVAWYDFSAQPAGSGNAVMSGHLDWDKVVAVFWRLRELETGDEIRVQWADGRTYTYYVGWKQRYPNGQEPVGEIVGPTPQRTLTLITCDGKFDRTTRNYEERLIVRAALSDS